MERNFYNEGFESFLREKTDEYKLYPSDKVWSNIHRKLHPRKKWPYLAAALLLLGIGVGTRYIVDQPNPGTGNDMEQLNHTASPMPVLPESSQVSSLGSGSDEDVLSQPLHQQMRVVSINPEIIEAPKENAPLRIVPSFVQESFPQIDNLPFLELEANPDQGDKLGPEDNWIIRHRPLASISGQPIAGNSSRLILETPSKLTVFMQQFGKVSKRSSWQLYFAPTVSYRKLVGRGTKSGFPSTGVMSGSSIGLASDVKDAVSHRPALGVELGTALIYPLSKNFRIKAGLQFNFNNYQVEAYSYKPEIATYAAAGPGSPRPVSTMSYYRNFNGYDKTTLRNTHFMISAPIGFELTVAGNDRVRFNLASTLQPTYVISNQSYMVSTNLKNYAQEPSLNRKWNMNAGMEAFLSMNTGTYSWVVGPQFRYQVLSSYKNKYPIQEHLLDFGFKVGVNKRLK